MNALTQSPVGDEATSISYLVSDSERIPVHRIQFDPNINRDLRQNHVDFIAKNLNPAALGTITVSERMPGQYVVLDGQHRVRALKDLRQESHLIKADVYRGLTHEQEAGMVVWLNETRRMTAIDRFLKRVEANDPVAVAIARIVGDAGLRIVKSGAGAEGGVVAVAALESSYRVDGTGDYLRTALRCIQTAWGDSGASFNGEIIYGVVLVLAKYNAIDVHVLTQKMASLSGGPNGLVGKARTNRETRGGSVARNVAAFLIDLYNKGRRNRVPSWWDK